MTMKILSILLGILLLHGCSNSNRTSKTVDSGEQQTWSVKDIMRADEYFEKGLKYDLDQEPEIALMYYDSAIMVYPGASYFTNRGAVKYELGDTLGAMGDFYDALKIDSLDYTTLTNIGVIYFESGNNEEALRYYQKSESLAPLQARIYLYIGNCEYKLTNYDNALKSFEKHVKSKYNDHLDYTFCMMGNCHEKLNESEVSEVYWKKSAEMGYEGAVAKMDSLKRAKK